MLPLSGERVNAKGIISEKLDSLDTIRGSSTLKRGFAHMQKNGVVMDVTNVEQALIAQEAGAVSVMVLDKLPSEVRKAGGVARTASIKIIEEIMDSVTIPVMAKCRIGHVSEALVLQETDVDMIDESEVLTPADELRHIWKWDLTTPVVNGARSLAEALRRIEEGASMIRTKGEPGTGNVAEAITHIKKVNDELRTIKSIYDSGDNQDLVRIAREFKVSYDIVEQTAKLGRLPVVNFAAGGIATPADAAYLMSLGCDGIFVGSGIFSADDAQQRANAIVLATTFWNESDKVKEAQKMIDERQSIHGLDVKTLDLIEGDANAKNNWHIFNILSENRIITYESDECLSGDCKDGIGTYKWSTGEKYTGEFKYGRRSVSWSTIAPTGSVSILTQTSSGCDPLFSPYYFRKKKVNPGENVRVDFVDQNGDSWQEFPVLHPKFKNWMK